MNRSFIGFGLTGLLGLGLALTVACSSSSSPSTPATPAGVGCSNTIAGSTYCYVYTNLTATQSSDLTQACTSGGGTSVTSCPTANLAGTCASTTAGYNIAESYYCPITPSIGQTACTATSGATWTAGTATCGDGGTTGSEDSGTPGDAATGG